MSTCSIQAPLDQDPPPRWSLGPWAHEPPRHVDFEEPILAHYIPRDSIQGRNDADGNLIEPYHMRFETRVPRRLGYQIPPGREQLQDQRIAVILDVFVIGPHCLRRESRLNTRCMIQDFMLRGDRLDARGEVIEKVIAFLMIEHPVVGILGSGLLTDFAALEDIRVGMLPHYVPVLPIKHIGDFHPELIGYIHRASLSGDLHPLRPDLSLSPSRPDWAERENQEREGSNGNIINENVSFQDNFYAAVDFLDRSLTDPDTLALARQILGRSSARRLGQFIHTHAPLI